MAKTKKRKVVQKRSAAEERASSREEGQQEPPAAATAVAVAPPKDVKKADKGGKPAKPAPVLTKKPSRLRFFVDAVNELRRAHWPSRREAIRLSIMVAAVCVVVGAGLGALDAVLDKLLGLLISGG